MKQQKHDYYKAVAKNTWFLPLPLQLSSSSGSSLAKLSVGLEALFLSAHAYHRLVYTCTLTRLVVTGIITKTSPSEKHYRVQIL